MLVALAGPGANLVLALVGAILFKAFSLNTNSGLGNFLAIFVLFNFVLFFFNLLPVFPLDGEKVLLYFLPYDLKEKLYRLRQYNIGPMLLLVLILPLLGINIVGWLVFNPAVSLTTLLLL
jgi:Zn-dependent protease